MKSACFFNNKGGVGKTTLACNIASYIATHYGLRVLLVDADPQCNATQLLLAEDVLEELYKEPRPRARQRIKREPVIADTLFDVLQPIAAGEPHIADSITPFPRSKNRFQIDLLPGHPQVSLLEDKLSQSWLSFGGGDLGGARVTNWNTQLRAHLSTQYDLVFYDVGPSLGALNRSVLVGTDFFVTPMGCDIFSIMGISNIARWLREWLRAYSDSLGKCREKWDIEEYGLKSDTASMSRFIGYMVQQYITKSTGGQRRATRHYERILARIPKAIVGELESFVSPMTPPTNLRLPDVPHMYSLIPLAQNANAPIHLTEAADGLTGAQYSQKVEYVAFIHALSSAVLENLGEAPAHES
ncbi:MAG: ParA family protein [Chloroflexi bacterium]|nr:ParA family protein [Chloroflexota bacterium]